MEEEKFEAGEEIIHADQHINHIYFIFQGFAEVEINVNDEIHKMDVLRSKDIIGQYKMLISSKPYFSVTALSPVIILKLRQEFLKSKNTKIVGVSESF
jgi:CRP-like cAMP-binding protein